MDKLSVKISGKGKQEIEVPSFILDYTSSVENLLELKASFTEMFTEWIVSENYKGKCEGVDYSAEIHQYIQLLFDAIFLAQKEGSVSIVLSVN